jgi:hypothetical protein
MKNLAQPRLLLGKIIVPVKYFTSGCTESNQLPNNDNYANYLAKVMYFVDFEAFLRLLTFWAGGATHLWLWCGSSVVGSAQTKRG